MNFSDSFFKKIEKKTNVNKDTILELASKLQQGDMKDENNLREVIQELSKLTGKEVSKEKEDKIISAVKSSKLFYSTFITGEENGKNLSAFQRFIGKFYIYRRCVGRNFD